MTNPEQTRVLLQNIAEELKRLDVWESSPPSQQALESVNPFCYDTLEIHQWLQWIFIPRIHALVDAGKTLPEQCDIASYAEVVYEKSGQDMNELIELIRSFDLHCSSAD